jgi:hypothetical protein
MGDSAGLELFCLQGRANVYNHTPGQRFMADGGD